MITAIDNLTIEKGTSFNESWRWVGQNLEGYTASFVIKDITKSLTLLTLDTENGGIVITPEIGNINVIMTTGQVALLVENCNYDLFLINESTILKIVKGLILIVD